MTITATRVDSTTNLGSARLTFRMLDAHHLPSSVSMKVIPGITDAQIGNIATDIETLSNAKCCDGELTIPFTVTGGKATAAAATYYDKYDLARLRYASAADCRDRIAFSVPAPIMMLFSGVANRVVDVANAALVALNGHLAGVLASEDGATDFSFDAGYRDTVNAPTPTGV
jgi:hypothetical protein